jgi:catechol 2,3-dioxygenase-like lactoylglutathione lyase family enzyme
MDWKLEVVVVPVTDVDRAKSFYADKLGFVVDVDTTPTEGVRIVQLTPPGSACSIMVGRAWAAACPGRSRASRSASVTSRRPMPSSSSAAWTVRRSGTWAPRGWEDGKGGDWNSFVFFDDPDGNGWAVQESPTIRRELLAADAPAPVPA